MKTHFMCEICDQSFACKQSKSKHKKMLHALTPGSDAFAERMAYVENQMYITLRIIL